MTISFFLVLSLCLSLFQVPDKVGNFGPRLCLEHFRKEDILTTRNGVKLKENSCPVNSTSGSNVIDDLDLVVTSDRILISTNSSLMAATSPLLKDVLRSHDHFEENTKILLPDYSHETLETYLELIHLGDVCTSGKQLEELRSLLNNLGIDQESFSFNSIDDVSLNEYLSRYSTGGGIEGGGEAGLGAEHGHCPSPGHGPQEGAEPQYRDENGMKVKQAENFQEEEQYEENRLVSKE